MRKISCKAFEQLLVRPNPRRAIRRSTTWVALLLGTTCGVSADEAQVSTAARNLEFVIPYVFVDRFPDSADVKALGFPSGPDPFLNLGLVVENAEAERAGTAVDIVRATATNDQVEFELRHQDIGILDLWDLPDLPEFDAEKHKGAWIITAVDSEGRTATTRPVLLDRGLDLPLVDDMKADMTASGDLTVSWSAPELDPAVQEKCDVDYRLRLLKDSPNQLYRSDRTTEPVVTVSAATLKERVGGPLDGVWARVEMACRDKEQKDDEGVGELEARSSTFLPLR